MIMAPGRCCKHKKISRYIQLQITGRKNEAVVYLSNEMFENSF